MNATKNWLPLPMTGRNGLPAAACQTSCSEESMCYSFVDGVGERPRGFVRAGLTKLFALISIGSDA